MRTGQYREKLSQQPGRLTAFSCSRYQVHEGRSAFSKHFVKSMSKPKISHLAPNDYREQSRTLRLDLAVRCLRLVGLLLNRRSRCLLRRGRGARRAEEHARQTVADGRTDRNGTCGRRHLCEHTRLRRCLSLRRDRGRVVRGRCLCAGVGCRGRVRTPGLRWGRSGRGARGRARRTRLTLCRGSKSIHADNKWVE